VVDQAVEGQDLEGVAEQLIDRLLGAGVLHPQPRSGSVPASRVTVVIPVRDRPEHLDALLASIESTTEHCGKPASILVVDDGSVDPAATAAVAEVHGVELLRLNESVGPAGARNAGLHQVHTPLVMFIDSDCAVTPGWLDDLLGVFLDDRVAVAAPRVLAVGGLGAAAQYDRSRSPLDLGDQDALVTPGSRVSYVPAAALVARTEVLQELGGFDGSLLVGEDVDLVWRVAASGRSVRYCPAAQVTHPPRLGLGQWCRQRFDYGTSAAALDQRHPGAVAPAACSPWSLAVWSVAAAGYPVLGVLVAGATAAASVQRLQPSGVPSGEAARLAVLGHLGAGRMLARASVRTWWPITLAAAVVSRRARRLALLAIGVSAADALRTRRDGPDPIRFAALTVLDDLSYGAGVWVGCAQERSFGALRPRVMTRPPGPADTRS